MIGNNKLSPCYGEMYVDTNKTISFTAPADVFHPLADAEEGLSKNVIVDKDNGQFKIMQSGCYKFDGVASLYPSGGMKINFALFVNGVKVNKIETSIDFKNSQDTQTFSGTGLSWLEKDDIVDVRAKTDTVPVDLTIEFFNIALFLL